MKKILTLPLFLALALPLSAEDFDKDFKGAWTTPINIYIGFLESGVYDFTATPKFDSGSIQLEAVSKRRDKKKWPDFSLTYTSLEKDADGISATTTLETRLGKRESRIRLLKEESIMHLEIDPSDFAALLGAKRKSTPHAYPVTREE